MIKCYCYTEESIWVKSSRSALEPTSEKRFIDACSYYDQDTNGITVLGVHVDDILITWTRLSIIESTLKSLSSLSVKNLGPVSSFLGMRVQDSEEDGYSLNQEPSICD